MTSVDAVGEPPLRELEPAPPRWVENAFGSTPAYLDLGPHVAGMAAGDLVLLKATIARATDLSVEAFRRRVTETYQQLGLALDRLERQAIRFWNFIPDLGAMVAPGIDRYMVFNAGRYDALVALSAADQASAGSLPTASAVGTNGDDLMVYSLASRSSAIAVENPRQRSAWLYSDRYGPRPPCFSRAAIATIHDRVRLLIGGTASIVGEESRHEVDVAAQLEETLQNLAAVITAATGAFESADRALARMIEARVYVTCEANAALIQQEIGRRLVGVDRPDIVLARICRPELLLEIEGVAEL